MISWGMYFILMMSYHINPYKEIIHQMPFVVNFFEKRVIFFNPYPSDGFECDKVYYLTNGILSYSLLLNHIHLHAFYFVF